ncbi:class I SAM-dependent methyltransferase [Paenibacillus oleatilyticus]|uniref:class I SAM-dependent methyltransferase n=1 Tax=Paenibacillus oleatilyticus TaxID=2594886 RepID=UPI001C1F85F8|nr:class I SAM-dependent methyltransferase [Paenibacillus oleatilyticus]MBU7317612.1 class I SAM-dependent methyltransferase [Paenibacillus oleatilyticus]
MEKRYLNIVHHYEKCLEKYGDSYLGVDWPNQEDAKKRYEIMMELITFRERNGSRINLLDFGCGASHLYEFITKKNFKNIHYTGCDISNSFIELSKQKFPDNTYYCIDILGENISLPVFDYVIMNGVFTEKNILNFEEMFDYFKRVITKVWSFTNKGLAFNVMSKQVDWEREDLFHLPLDLVSEFLCKNITRNFIIRNDYGLYEYTVYIYKNS